MPLFSFVILHYNTYQDTIECVNSIIMNIGYKNYHIIIVENGSKNDSGKLLKDKYENQKQITVIINNKNLGFAKGNNIGFEFAKYQLKSDFIALINNDTLIKQEAFISKTIEKYQKYDFHILGPDIISTIDNAHQNPRDENLDTLENVRKHIKHHKKMLILNYLFLDRILVGIKKSFIPSSKLPSAQTTFHKKYNEELLNVKLHGSAMIFSKNYIDRYDGLYPGTFMYSEESILNFIANRDNLKTLYSPEITIFHKEDSATNSVFKNKALKRRFYLKNYIKSGNKLIKLMNNDERWPKD